MIHAQIVSIAGKYEANTQLTSKIRPLRRAEQMQLLEAFVGMKTTYHVWLGSIASVMLEEPFNFRASTNVKADCLRFLGLASVVSLQKAGGVLMNKVPVSAMWDVSSRSTCDLKGAIARAAYHVSTGDYAQAGAYILKALELS